MVFFFCSCCRKATQFSEQDSETSTWRSKSQSEEMLQALGTFSSTDTFMMEGENIAQMLHHLAGIGKWKPEKLLRWFKKMLHLLKKEHLFLINASLTKTMKSNTLVLKENFSFLSCNYFITFWIFLVCCYHFKATGISWHPCRSRIQ